MTWVLTFAAVFALDIVWARYTLALTNDRPLRAGAYAAGIAALGGYAAISYVSDPWQLIPACAGAFCGTLVGMVKE